MDKFTLLIKPTGSDCNLDCRYCFYKHREPEIGSGRQRMSGEVLEKLVKDYMELRFPVCGFTWQGGEPTLMGLEFYERLIELQKKYGAAGQKVGNGLQTNGILLDERWCRFLAENKFLVGISIDGPREMHDHYRRNLAGQGTFDQVLRAIECCKAYKVEFNTLTLLNDRNVEHADGIFDFLVQLGVRYAQFIPCVEPGPEPGQVAEYSITPRQYGNFLCRLFDRWYEHGPDRLSIRDFDSILAYCMTGRPTICTFDWQCSQYVVVEHTGEAFCCDFFVQPRWRLGNVLESPIGQLVASPTRRTFSQAKQRLSDKCLVCRYLNVCRGGCLKHRIVLGGQMAGSASYFCQAYRQFFDHAMPRFHVLAAAANQNRPAGRYRPVHPGV